MLNYQDDLRELWSNVAPNLFFIICILFLSALISGLSRL